MTSHAIRHVRVTPIAFRDPPLLNAAGIHEPWALRSIIEIETDSGLVGINESYGDLPMLDALAKAAPALTGLSPWALNDMETRVAALVTPEQTSSEFLGTQVSLAPGTHVSKTVAKVISAFEVAMMDLQGQLANAPVVDLLGGAARPGRSLQRLPVLQVRRAHRAALRARPVWRRHRTRTDGGAGTPHDRSVRLQEHQAQGRCAAAGAGSRRPAGPGQSVPRRAAAHRPQRQLDRGHQPERGGAAARRAGVLRRPGPGAGRHGCGGRKPAKCRWPPTWW